MTGNVDLPITPLIPALISSLDAEPNLVLQAPPGIIASTCTCIQQVSVNRSSFMLTLSS
jgi:hypothetical protein